MEKDNSIEPDNQSFIIDIEELCTSTWKEVYGFIYYKVQNREEAEDITQETYVKAFAYLKNNKIKVEKYSSFLKTIALNIIRDNWRKKKRQGSNLNIDDINPEELSQEDFTEASASRDLIEEALQSLSADQRTVVELRIIKGYSTAETAAIMHRNEGTIRVIQYRALQSLTATLKRMGFSK